MFFSLVLFEFIDTHSFKYLESFSTERGRGGRDAQTRSFVCARASRKRAEELLTALLQTAREWRRGVFLSRCLTKVLEVFAQGRAILINECVGGGEFVSVGCVCWVGLVLVLVCFVTSHCFSTSSESALPQMRYGTYRHPLRHSVRPLVEEVHPQKPGKSGATCKSSHLACILGMLRYDLATRLGFPDLESFSLSAWPCLLACLSCSSFYPFILAALPGLAARTYACELACIVCLLGITSGERASGGLVAIRAQILLFAPCRTNVRESFY